jgi:hypothetical protein
MLAAGPKSNNLILTYNEAIKWNSN